MRRKHYLITHNGEVLLKGDAYELSKILEKSIVTIHKRASDDGIITYDGLRCKIKAFKHLFQFIDKEGYVIFEGTLNECSEEMLYSKQYIVSAACNDIKIDNYTVKEVEYLEGYGYYG